MGGFSFLVVGREVRLEFSGRLEGFIYISNSGRRLGTEVSRVESRSGLGRAWRTGDIVTEGGLVGVGVGEGRAFRGFWLVLRSGVRCVGS